MFCCTTYILFIYTASYQNIRQCAPEGARLRKGLGPWVEVQACVCVCVCDMVTSIPQDHIHTHSSTRVYKVCVCVCVPRGHFSRHLTDCFNTGDRIITVLERIGVGVGGFKMVEREDGGCMLFGGGEGLEDVARDLSELGTSDSFDCNLCHTTAFNIWCGKMINKYCVLYHNNSL